MKKTIALVLALCLAITALCGCGGKKELEPESFVKEILSGARFTDSLDQVGDAVVPILYGIDENDYSKAIVYCGTAATAEEVAVFTAKDSAAADRILTACKARVASQIESYKDYGPAAAMVLEKAICQKAGNNVVVVVCTDSDGANKIAGKYLG